jgi:hypothetical protein
MYTHMYTRFCVSYEIKLLNKSSSNLPHAASHWRTYHTCVVIPSILHFAGLTRGCEVQMTSSHLL